MRMKLATAIMAAGMILIAGMAISADDHDHDHDHGHHHTAPHGGTLIAFGEEAAHLELVLDPAAGALTGYVLDGEAENSIRIKQPEIQLQIAGGDVASTLTVALKAVANPLTGEKTGDTSQFEAANDDLKNKKRFTVTVDDITIKGQKFERTKSSFPAGNH